MLQTSSRLGGQANLLRELSASGGKKREADIIFLGRVFRNGQLVLEFNCCFVTAGRMTD